MAARGMWPRDEEEYIYLSFAGAQWQPTDIDVGARDETLVNELGGREGGRAYAVRSKAGRVIISSEL
jgi:hypothetical protein